MNIKDRKGNYLDGYGKSNCSHCGLNRTKEGHDGCIGKLPSVMNACCGHGQNTAAYVQFDHEDYNNDPNKILLTGNEALEYIKEMKELTQKELNARALIAGDLMRDGEITRVECFRLEIDSILGENTGDLKFEKNKDFDKKEM